MKTQMEPIRLVTAYCDCGAKLLFRCQEMEGMNSDSTHPQAENGGCYPTYIHTCLKSGKKITLRNKYPRFEDSEHTVPEIVK